MRLRRIEFFVVALTLAFVCFMGGYFVGSRGTVNIVAVAPQNSMPHDSRAHDVQQTNGYSAPPVVSAPGAAGSSDNNTNEVLSSNAPAASSGHSGSEEVPGAPRLSDGRININTASRSELMDLPGIGSVLASRIVDYRAANGPFSRVEDLRNVTGIGEKRFEAIADKVTVG